MKFLDLAREYSDLNVFTPDTQLTLLRAARLFVNRTGIEHCEEIGRDHVIQFKAVTLSRARPITYNGYLRYLRLIGDYAVEQNLMDKNVFRYAKTAPTGKKIPKTQSIDSVMAALQHLEAGGYDYEPIWFWQAVIKCLYYTGIRRKQLVNIEVGDIDFKASSLKLNYEGSKTHREWYIPIHSDLTATLHKLQDELVRVLGRSLRPTDTLFNLAFLSNRYCRDPRRIDGLRPRAITDFFKRIKRNSGICVSAHRFRHSLATELCNPIDGQADILSAQVMLGHTSLQTTRVYVQTSVAQIGHSLNKIPTLNTKLSSEVPPMPI